MATQVKDKKKKWLFFDNWRVNVKGIDVAKNYEIEVAKGRISHYDETTYSKIEKFLCLYKLSRRCICVICMCVQETFLQYRYIRKRCAQ